jgi:hypothetical protein
MSKRVLLLAAAAILAGLAFTGCSDDSDSTPPPSSTAKIRVVHASPDAGLIDIYIGTTSVTPWLEDVAYGTASTYFSRDSGTIVLVMREADADPATDPGTASDPIDMAAGASLTALVAGLVGSNAPEDQARLVIYSDNFQTSPTARARVVHAGSDAPTVSVSVGATTQVLANNLARWAESGRDGNVYDTGVIQDIVVQATDSQVTSFRAPALEAQKDYYFFLIGLILDPGAATAPFDLLIVGPGGTLGLEETTPRDFRLIHALSDFAPFDPYLVYGFGDGLTRVRITQSMGYGEVTQYDEVTVRQVFIEIYNQGANPVPTQLLFAQPAYIYDESISTTIVAAGLGETTDEEAEARLISLADSFGLSPVGALSVRVVHTSPNLDDLTVDFGGFGGVVVTASRFSGNTEGPFNLTADTAITMEVRDSLTSTLVDEFTTPPMTEDKDFYLILTGIKDGMPGFELLLVNEDMSFGFWPPN